MFPSSRNQSIDLQSKSINWFLYDRNIGGYGWSNQVFKQVLFCQQDSKMQKRR